MVSAIAVAKYLVRLASPSEDEDADCLSHMRLQKLLYYAQGWHLAARGKPLFAGRIEAWTHGPVVKELYPAFRDYGCKGIPPTEGEESADLTDADKASIQSVWDSYKQYSATALREMTHREGPWKQARGGLKPNERCNVEISQESMRAFFLPKLQEGLCRIDPCIKPAAWEANREALNAGKAKTTREIRGELQRSRSRPNP